MRWRSKDIWKAGIALAGMLLLLVLVVLIPASAVSAQESALGLATPVTGTVQVTPTEDATVTALNKEKLKGDIAQQQHTENWFWSNGATILSSFFSTLVIVSGALIAFWRWRGDQRTEQDKRAEERFQSAVTGLGDEKEGAKIGAAILLRTFLRPGYEQFYIQTFDLAVANLRLPRNSKPQQYQLWSSTLDSDAPLLPTTLSQALIVVFKEAFPLAQSQNKGGPQSLDASRIKLDKAALSGAPLKQAWMPEASLRGADLRGADLTGANLADAKLVEADLRGAILVQTDFSRADLSKANFNRTTTLLGANLSNTTLLGANFKDASYVRLADFTEVNLSGADLGRADLSEFLLFRANLSNANLALTNLSKTHLEGANLTGAWLSGAILEGTYLLNADLSRTFLWGSNLSRSNDLNTVNFSEANFIGVDLRGADLSGANLSGANLSGVDLSLTKLSEANLHTAILSRTILHGTDLHRANLHETKLWEADLREANLSGADLGRAELRKANLRGANLGGVKLEDALSLIDTNLRGVKGLTKEQLEACKAKYAIIDEDTTTSLPQSPVSPSPPSQSNEAQALSTPSAQGNTPTSDAGGNSAPSSKPDLES